MSVVPKNIAIIGSGISGLVAAHLLSRRHQVTVFEAEASIGGHTATKRIEYQGEQHAIDTGFIVFNDRTYPNFIALLQRLKVAYQPTDMGFSVTCRSPAFEYSGTSFNGLFAQRRNLLNLRYLKMLTEILRFNRACTRAYQAQQVSAEETLGEYLARNGYSDFFAQHYILPMVSAIWSSGLATAAAMPLAFFVRFFHNHGLLTVTNQPQWYTLKGGSQAYLAPLTQPFAERIFTDCPVQQVRRERDQVRVTSTRFGEQIFDEVVFACHSDQALALLADPSPAEQAILGAIPYQPNEVTLHTDERLLPRSRRAWASWNYLMPDNPGATPQAEEGAALTYNMNILQCLTSAHTFCVSVNANRAIAPERILGQYHYSHPVFTRASIAAQARWAEISGQQHSHYCGAYWRNGFHEDGVVSGLQVAAALGEHF